jgi:GYF domain 2
MAVQWFYGVSQAKLGPFSARQLKELSVLGRLKPTDMVWKEGVTNGLPAGDIRGLFSSIQADAVVITTADLPVPSAVLEHVLVLPFETASPVAPAKPAAEVIREDLGLKSMPDGRELEAEPVNSIPGLQFPDAPIAAEVEPAPTNSAPTHLEPKVLVAPAAERPRAKPPAVKVKRAIVECGAIIVSQDGERVRFRKKCVRCSFEESCNTVMRLMPGLNRQSFFCPKCRKLAEIMIRAV